MSQTATYEMIGQFLLIASFFNNYLKKKKKTSTNIQIHISWSIFFRMLPTARSIICRLYAVE